MIEFHTLIAELNPSYLLHWSHAEKTFYNTAWKKHKLNGFDKIDIWGDMLKVFRDEPITIKGALNFSLKSIAKAFYKHGFIKTIWPNTVISDGMAAMIQAYDCYKTAKKNNINDIMVLQIMKDIKKYNEVDCKVLWEILSYLVKHYVNI
jgi:predicted RecB family nuclease